jgi:phage-related protein
MGADPRVLKPVHWVGSSRRDLKTFPREVQREIGQALYAAQRGDEYPSVKALKGFGGRSILEIVTGSAEGTYRTVYTVRFQESIYVLHAFQKKSKKGVATPQTEMELIHKRLLDAEQDYKRRQN